MSWLEKLIPSKIGSGQKKSNVPEGLWTKCHQCDAVLYRTELEKNLNVCPQCDHHMRISGRLRLEHFLDRDDTAEDSGRQEIGTELSAVDELKFKDTKKYKDRLSAAQKTSGETDALIAMRGKVCNVPVVAAAFEFKFIGGSMGSVVGERFVRAAEVALKHHIPFVCFAASGGARMQEGLFSLMQMAKTSAVLAKLSSKGIPYISVLTDPTTGGVSASLAMLGDINIGEPKALIGFAGRRVIEQTVRETLPDDFQTSEFLLKHGALDMIVHRLSMRETIASILSTLHFPVASTTNSKLPLMNAIDNSGKVA